MYSQTYTTKAYGVSSGYKCTVRIPFHYKQVHEMVSIASTAKGQLDSWPYLSRPTNPYQKAHFNFLCALEYQILLLKHSQDPPGVKKNCRTVPGSLKCLLQQISLYCQDWYYTSFSDWVTTVFIITTVLRLSLACTQI